MKQYDACDKHDLQQPLEVLIKVLQIFQAGSADYTNCVKNVNITSRAISASQISMEFQMMVYIYCTLEKNSVRENF